MRRFWLHNPLSSDAQELTIRGEDFHHIFEVCRFHVGESFELLGLIAGQAIQVEVLEIKKKEARVKPLSSRLLPQPAKPHIVLHLSVPKYPTLDAITEKMVEMGVSRLELLCSEHSFVRSPKEFSQHKLERLKKIIVAATAQTGRGTLMECSGPKSWAEHIEFWVNRPARRVGLIGYEGLMHQPPLKTQWSSLWSSSPLDLEEVHLWVGSEGGWSPHEVEELRRYQVLPISLGNQVLRVETACMTLVAACKYELGLM